MVISSWTITNQRKEQVAFVEYLRMGQVFVCKKGIMVKNEQDLAGKIVAVGADTVQYRYVKGVKDKGVAIKEIKVLSEGDDPFPVIKQGDAEVTVVDEPVGRYQARSIRISWSLASSAMRWTPPRWAWRFVRKIGSCKKALLRSSTP
jgi:ABC-type amino acid transport substrate-binding protein